MSEDDKAVLVHRLNQVEIAFSAIDGKLDKLIDSQVESQLTLRADQMKLDGLEKSFEKLSIKLDTLVTSVGDLITNKIPVALYRLDKIEEDNSSIGSKVHTITQELHDKVDQKTEAILNKVEKKETLLDGRLRKVEMKGMITGAGSGVSLIAILEAIKYMTGMGGY